MKLVISLALIVTVLFPLVSAGVGISWDRESALIPENEETCLTYKVYNPWESDTYAKIELSDSLNEIISSGYSDVKFIPAQTSSGEAIPVTFCFKTSKVYSEDCLMGNSFCEQTCTEEMKMYSGEVEVIETAKDASLSGTGGSATQMSVSAPLNVRVQCVAHSRSFASLYVTIAVIAGVLLLLNYLRIQKGTVKKKKRR